MSDIDVAGLDRLPDRARDAMLTMDLRRKRALLQAAEERANGLDVDAAVAELRTRLGRTLADRRRLHAGELVSARAEAERTVAAARVRAEQILAESAERGPTSDERDDPAWWPSATNTVPVPVVVAPPVDELMQRRERARNLLARPVEPESEPVAEPEPEPEPEPVADSESVGLAPPVVEPDPVEPEPEPELPPAALAAPVDPWQQYGPPAPAPAGFDSNAFAAALAVALAPLLEGNRSAPQQIVLRPVGPQKKPAFKTTAGHLDVVLAFVALAIVLSVFVAWMA